ncbi:TetR family transcriptional regulator [Micromonospora profundi]|uniref:TetR family transcriptional regulator n=1 Tax=Micromonospora profundi TaxID=1420889 RepID=A0AAJ6HWH4_9ACTN|nr:TetR family transcriptional regulator [Micromonospora profundi]NJC14239.1 AcrR family transcriptional regulator [Micromonospora profundi]WLS45803.1 TetR family transcriptional regulator [Micromonospora profundi]
MSDATALTADRILDTAEEALRRYGPAKATVLDVARALGVSHGSVYRHFASKAALREAVAERWLARVSTPLVEVATGTDPAPQRLRRWLAELSGTKRRMAREDPELFDNFHQLATLSEGAVANHLEILAGQLSLIVADGIAAGDFDVPDPAVAGRALLQATARFHHPSHRTEWTEPGLDADMAAVIGLLLDGLRTRPAN